MLFFIRLSLTLIVFSLLPLSSAHAIRGFSFSFLFDNPLSVTVLPLTQYNGYEAASSLQNAYFSLSCYYYPTFMVKEIDTLEKGAAKISITPSTPQVPASCQEKSSEEMMINLEGYFVGAKANSIFLENSDSHNGAAGIIMITPQGGVIFNDERGNLQNNRKPSVITEDHDGPLTLRYTRFFEASCSLFGKSKEECWQQIKKETGLQGPRPGCPLPPENEYYQSNKKNLHLKQIPTVVEYNVVARVTDTISTMQPEPLIQKDIYCRPAS